MAKGKVIHGARVGIFFAGKKIGVLTSLTENEDFGQQAVYGIGELTPFEIVALRFSGNFSYSKLVLSTDALADLKYPEREGKTLAAISREILTQEGFTITIEDKYTQANIASISGCKLSTLSLSVSENAIVQQNGSGLYGEPIAAP